MGYNLPTHDMSQVLGCPLIRVLAATEFGDSRNCMKEKTKTKKPATWYSKLVTQKKSKVLKGNLTKVNWNFQRDGGWTEKLGK